MIDPTHRKWTAPARLGGTAPSTHVVVVAVVGRAGRVLCDYYDKAGHETQSWVALGTLTDDALECDRRTFLRIWRSHEQELSPIILRSPPSGLLLPQPLDRPRHVERQAHHTRDKPTAWRVLPCMTVKRTLPFPLPIGCAACTTSTLGDLKRLEIVGIDGGRVCLAHGVGCEGYYGGASRLDHRRLRDRTPAPERERFEA